MKQPKISLKNVKFHEGRDVIGVNADVYIDGVKCYHVRDDGNGGCLDFDDMSYGSKNPEQIISLINNLNDYVETIPMKPLDFGYGTIKDEQGNVRMDKTTLEDYINELITIHEKEKAKKKLVNQMNDSILYGYPNQLTNSYSRIKFSMPLVKISKDYLQNRIDLIMKEKCGSGRVIMNTNLEALGLKIN